MVDFSTSQQIQKRKKFDDLKESKPEEYVKPLQDYYKNMSAQNLQYLREKDTYEHEPDKLKTIERTKNFKKTGILSMRNAIEEVMPGQYADLYAIQNSLNKRDRTKALHHAKGTSLFKSNHDVLEFDIAGSEFKHPRHEYNGFHGKDGDSEAALKKQYGEKVTAGAGSENIGVINKVLSFFSRLFLKGPVKPQYVRRKKNDITAAEAKRRAIELGMDAATANRISFDNRQKVRYTIAGPQSPGGVFNAGEYSIQNNRQRIFEIGKEFLSRRFKTWDSKGTRADIHTIDLMFSGHSRGAVGEIQGAMMIKRWIHDNYPQYDQHVVFHVKQYDPVAGKGSNYWGFEKVDHVQTGDGAVNGEKDLTVDGEKMRSLGNSADTTVIYSLNTDHKVNLKHAFTETFVPQQILNAKRVILTPFNHSTTLSIDNADFSQMGKETRAELRAGKKEKGHELPFKDIRNGEVYRRSGLEDLEEGMFITDEYGVLVKITNLDTLYDLMNKALPRNRDQWGRYEVITKVAAHKLGVPWDEETFNRKLKNPANYPPKNQNANRNAPQNQNKDNRGQRQNDGQQNQTNQRQNATRNKIGKQITTGNRPGNNVVNKTGAKTSGLKKTGNTGTGKAVNNNAKISSTSKVITATKSSNASKVKTGSGSKKGAGTGNKVQSMISRLNQRNKK